MYHLRREIDHNLQLATYYHTTEITKVQEWILVKLRIVDRQSSEFVMNINMKSPSG